MLHDALAAWAEVPPSRLASHDGSCCRLARAWLIAMDRSWHQWPGDGALPTWIRRRYEWGPVAWPLFWCEAVHASHLDCGALAAISREVIGARGSHVMPVQAIQCFPAHSCRQWENTWKRGGYNADWTRGNYAYHELCGIVSDATVRLWDPTDNAWVHPVLVGAYGSTAAVRIWRENYERGSHGAELEWDGLRLPLARWYVVEAPLEE